MTALSVRRFQPADEDAVWDLHVRALRDAGAYDEDLEELDADLHAIESAYFDVGGEFIVGTLDGEIVAVGGFQPVEAVSLLPEAIAAVATGRAAVLRHMRVDPDHQRQGYGTAILTELEDRAAEADFDEVILETTAVQTAAIAFYQAHGYEQRRRGTFGDHDVLFYGKPVR